MTQNTIEKLKIIATLLVVFVLIGWYTAVNAGPPKRGGDTTIDKRVQSFDNSVTNEALSDSTSMSDSAVSNTSRSLGLGGGDVDINECYRSFNYGIVYQDTKVNRLCFADSLDARHLHEAAAVMRCSVRSIRKQFNDKDACLEMMQAAPSMEQEITELRERIAFLLSEREQDKTRCDESVERIGDELNSCLQK